MITCVELVNAVGGGNLECELNLSELQNHFSFSSEYEPEQHPGLYFEYPETGVTVMLFRTGEYHLTGGKSIEKLRMTTDGLSSVLSNVLPELKSDEITFDVRNLVHTADIGQELELSELAIGLGLNATEYNPEQFPGLVYSNEKFGGTFLIFRSGKVVLTGCKTMSAVDSSFDYLNEQLKKLFNFDDAPTN
jgi:transcription initiation factor TFIID TATA-box-binding protein